MRARTVVVMAVINLFLPVRGVAWQEQVYRPGEGVVTPKLLKEVKPDYTPATLTGGVEGVVTLECVVRADGRPAEIRVIKPLHPELDEAASQALARWMFEPGKKDGLPVPVRVEVEMAFALRDDPLPAPKGPAVDSPEVFKPGNGVTMPVIVREVKPMFPPSAMRDGAHGSVYLECVVLPDGTVGDVRLKRRVHRDLDDEAVRSLRRWTFKPGMKDGVAVPVQVEVQMTFTVASRRLP